MKKIFYTIGFLALFLGIFFYVWLSQQKIKTLVLGSKIIDIEIVEKQDEQEKGLSKRKNLCQDCGMLFIFEKNQQHLFWMKDMNFDLDIIWISEGKVVGIEKNISREKGMNQTFGKDIKSDQVLEINAGKSDEWGIKEGDRASL